MSRRAGSAGESHVVLAGKALGREREELNVLPAGCRHELCSRKMLAAPKGFLWQGVGASCRKLRCSEHHICMGCRRKWGTQPQCIQGVKVSALHQAGGCPPKKKKSKPTGVTLIHCPMGMSETLQLKSWDLCSGGAQLLDAVPGSRESVAMRGAARSLAMKGEAQHGGRKKKASF